VLSYHSGSLNDQGQIYLMPDWMTGLGTVTLNNAFEHAQYLENLLVRPGCQTAHAYSRTERMTVSQAGTPARTK